MVLSPIIDILIRDTEKKQESGTEVPQGERGQDRGRDWRGAAKDCWQPPETRKKQGKILAYSFRWKHG